MVKFFNISGFLDIKGDAQKRNRFLLWKSFLLFNEFFVKTDFSLIRISEPLQFPFFSKRIWWMRVTLFITLLPRGPFLPGGPLIPIGPISPERPSLPSKPSCPRSPFIPGGPWSPGYPGAPGWPWTPLGPGGPDSPLLPWTPEVPVLPCSPLGPSGPGKPYLENEWITSGWDKVWFKKVHNRFAFLVVILHCFRQRRFWILMKSFVHIFVPDFNSKTNRCAWISISSRFSDMSRFPRFALFTFGSWCTYRSNFPFLPWSALRPRISNSAFYVTIIFYAMLESLDTQ